LPRKLSNYVIDLIGGEEGKVLRIEFEGHTTLEDGRWTYEDSL
jgi:hypothetical protein